MWANNANKGMLMKKLIATAITFFACVSAFAFESYEGYYIEQSIEAYQTVADAIEGRRESAGGTDPRVMLSNTMNNFVVQRNGLRKARNIFEQFKESKNFSIKTSSTLMSSSLMAIEIQLDIGIKQTEKILNLSNSEFLKQAGTYTREIQETSASINDLWEVYMKASGTVPTALIEGMDKDPMSKDKDTLNKKMSKLVVTRKFVNDTKKSINTRFKSLMEKYNKKDFDSMRQYQIPVVVLYQFLGDSWKTSDEK